MPMPPGITVSSVIPFIYTSRQLGQIVTNTTTETAFAFQSDCIIPAGTLKPGDELWIEQDGVYQSGLSQSVQPFVRIGTAAMALTSRTTIITTAGAVSGLLNSATDLAWGASTKHIVQADGVSMVSSGRLFFSTGATVALNVLIAQTAAVTIDPTVANVVTASAAWSAANTANKIRAVTWSATLKRPTA